MNYTPVRGLAKLDEIMEAGRDGSKVYQHLCIPGVRPRYFVRGECLDSQETAIVTEAYRHGKLFFTEL